MLPGPTHSFCFLCFSPPFSTPSCLEIAWLLILQATIRAMPLEALLTKSILIATLLRLFVTNVFSGAR